MNKSIFQIIMLFLIFTIYNCNLQPLQPQQATEHFYNHVKDIVENQLSYQIFKEVKNSSDSFSMVVNNKQTYACTIGMRFETAYNAYAKKKGIFTIKGAHSQEVTKYIFQYYQEEIDMQMEIINQLIIRIGELELDNRNNIIKDPFFIHLIQDVRMSIIENNKNHRIEFDTNVQDDFIVMDLKSRESTLAQLKVNIRSEKSNNTQGIEKTEFIMVVNVQNLLDEEQEQLNIEIPMISRNVNEFKQRMTLVHNYLNLDNYSNNNREHYLNLVDYLNNQFQGFSSITTTDLEKQWELIKFEMQFKDKKATGSLTYDSENNNYELETIQNGRIMQKFTFQRMSNIELHNLYKTNKLHSLFQTINQIVLELFVDKHSEIVLPVLPNWVLQKYEKKRGYLASVVLKDYLGYQNANNFLFTVDNHTDQKKVEITYYGYNLSNLKFTHTYPAQRFQLETAALYIDYILKAHLDLMRENNILNVNYMI